MDAIYGHPCCSDVRLSIEFYFPYAGLSKIEKKIYE